MRPLGLARSLGIAPALLLMAAAAFAISPLSRENPRVVADAVETRIDSPRLFGGDLADASRQPAPPSDVFPGLTGRARASLATQARNKIAGMPLPVQAGQLGPRGGCETSASDLCYDLADRHITYRPARQYMPKLDGFTAESVTLRRDGIRFRYSFR